MLHFRRRISFDGRASRHLDLVGTRHFRVYVADAKGMVRDTSVDGPSDPSGRSQLSIVLDGEFTRGKSGPLRPGDVLADRASNGVSERWLARRRFRVLVAEWDAQALGNAVDVPRTGTLSRVEIARASRLAQTLRDGCATRTGCLELFRGLGVDLQPDQACQESLSQLQPLATAAGSATSALHHAPMVVDLARYCTWSPRHMRRHFPALGHCLTGRAIGFRKYVLRLRVTSATALLSSPHFSIDNVARVVGYQSSRAMRKAFEQNGVRSPSTLRRHFRNL